MPQTSPPTRSGSRKLSEIAKHLAVPRDIAATGWPAVRKTCVEKMGVEFDDWQDAAGRVIMAKRRDGSLAAMVDGVGMSLPRQVGKTYLIAALTFALCVNMPGLLVIWSAHHARTHGETFLALQAFAERLRVKPHVKQIFTGSGDEEIRFHNGSRILFGARERGFGRGIPGVDVLIFDEAQILSDKALSNMLATMNTSRFGLQLYIGTPPKPDDMSEAFTRMRSEALATTLHDGAWIEFGADADADVNDRGQWRKANPSFPKRTPVQSILRLQRKLTEDDFLREGMGVWDASSSHRVVEQTNWDRAADQASMPVERISLAIDVAPDRSVAALAFAGQRADGNWHVALEDQKKGTDWIAPMVTDLASKNDLHAVVVDELSGLVETRNGRHFLAGTDRKVRVTLAASEGRDMAIACGKFYDGVTAESPTVFHTDQPQLNVALSVARKRPIGAGWGWNRKDPKSDITPLVAVTLALWGAQKDDVKRPLVDSGTGMAVVV